VNLVRLLVLTTAFAASAWAGWALAAQPVRGGGGTAPPAPAGPAPAVQPPAAPLGDLDASAAPAPAAADAAPVRLTFADISSFDLDPKAVQVPASVQALHGRNVDIVGYMIPYGNPDAVEEFVLVRDLGSCCFGQAPLPHHVIECRFEEGKRFAYVPGPLRVRGRLRIEEHRMGQYLVSIYAMSVSDCVEVR